MFTIAEWLENNKENEEELEGIKSCLLIPSNKHIIEEHIVKKLPS